MLKAIFRRTEQACSAPTRPAAAKPAVHSLPNQAPNQATEQAGGASTKTPLFNPKVRWWSDSQWLAKYHRHVQGDGFDGLHPHRILDRRFTLSQFARTVRSLRGSTAECGVFKGISSAIICEALRDTYQAGERHYGFDSFEGLPETGTNDAHWKRGDLADPITTAQKHLQEFSFVQLIKGWLPETLSATNEVSFRLVHIDVDIERTTWECLAHFYPRVIPGGLVLLDDYGFHSCPGARQAADAFLQDKPETLIELTTGQAAIFKV